MSTLLRYDLPASLVVFLVALPLSLGIAIASDAPVLAGLIAAIVGGVVAGALGGSPLQVSGPAAGLTVIVAGLVAEFGWAVTCAITVCAGIVQVLLGVSRVGRAALAISPMVVHAMLAGIGITIALQQVHVLLGGSSESSAWRNITELPGQLLAADHAGLAVGLLVIGILVSWRWMPAKIRKVPGPLVAIVVASAVSVLFAMNVPRIQLNGSLLDALKPPGLPEGNWGAFATGVITVALIASVESLLTAVAVDRMQDGPRSNLNRELVGQGAANVVSGAIGGLPITGVIVRSSANVAAGAKTRASAMLHGVWVLVFALPFAGLAQQIPTAALAGLLIVIGIQLVKLSHIKTARRTGDIAVYLVTITGVVFLNLLEGVLLGLALAVALTVWRVARARVHAQPADDDDDDNDDWRVAVEGSATFLSLPQLHKTLASVPPGVRVTLEISVDFIDHAAHQVIEDWQRQHEASGGSVLIQEVGSVELSSALDGPPQRAFGMIDKRLGIVPWSSWQDPVTTNGHERRDTPAQSVLDGLEVYHRRTAPQIRPHMEKLAHTNTAETLFITCTDARIVPNAITSSGPGDLFTVRNVGNLVPADQHDHSVEAAIAFAVGRLNVSSIVVCGHSACSAMHAALREQGVAAQHPPGEEHLRSWLKYAQPALDAFDEGRHPIAQSAAEQGFNTADQLSMVSVAVQVDTLVRHPLIRDLHEQGRLKIIGLFYDIGSAQVLHVEPASALSLQTNGIAVR
ncbi:SulP family inorganic anion transporter [Mycolicibacterium aichiense]|uniref:Transmembrane carbonic anhydrase n=2 Tax=Mycolicibacterium TaxID=1866885 RepID=A0AAD1HNM2_9MYCO|nr:bifunctional SulP family inorganic anion transporter/carbonic anhydrase [Mycolicibacterium aichiense]MCV7018253.1 bifunctional SulP family inorganic anion transporter/carbonic anhydrase [Mycolicibacterium aichiense]BBX08737.1 putative transmembrane carbonic anhydrase [Mycolicibacterium aichiense]STZ82530.1 sulfate permease [Mycolicibacterium aichiense]